MIQDRMEWASMHAVHTRVPDEPNLRVPGAALPVVMPRCGA